MAWWVVYDLATGERQGAGLLEPVSIPSGTAKKDVGAEPDLTDVKWDVETLDYVPIHTVVAEFATLDPADDSPKTVFSVDEQVRVRVTLKDLAGVQLGFAGNRTVDVIRYDKYGSEGLWKRVAFVFAAGTVDRDFTLGESGEFGFDQRSTSEAKVVPHRIEVTE